MDTIEVVVLCLPSGRVVWLDDNKMVGPCVESCNIAEGLRAAGGMVVMERSVYETLPTVALGDWLDSGIALCRVTA